MQLALVLSPDYHLQHISAESCGGESYYWNEASAHLRYDQFGYIHSTVEG